MPLAGDIIDAADVPGDWSTYTPALTGTTSGGTVGNGTITGRYQQLGKLVTVMIELTWGSTTSAGVGSAQMSLPVNARATTPAAVGIFGGLDASAGANGRFCPGIVYLNTVSAVIVVQGAAGGAATGIGSLLAAAATPTWTTSDTWRYLIQYEAA